MGGRLRRVYDSDPLALGEIRNFPYLHPTHAQKTEGFEGGEGKECKGFPHYAGAKVRWKETESLRLRGSIQAFFLFYQDYRSEGYEIARLKTESMNKGAKNIARLKGSKKVDW